MRNILKTLCAVTLAIVMSGPVMAATASISYSYDAAGRLVTALHSDGTCILYQYDAAGNVEERRVQTGSLTGAQWGTIPYGCFRWSL